MNPLKDEHNCQFCGKPSTNILFAAFVCDSEECINQAYDQRGGPGGHKICKDSDSEKDNKHEHE
jgi:hypothetical protein